jgi:serine phosphatase RsbU (regulator of sigma subunit)
MGQLDPENLRLTDFLEVSTLQEIQDSFAAVANVKATITDAAGNVITQPVPTSEFLRRQQVLQLAEEEGSTGPQRDGAEYVAPIIVNNQRLGTVRMSANNGSPVLDDAKAAALAEKLGIEPRQVKALASQLARSRNVKPAAIQFLFMLANAMARLCYQEFQLRQRINELTAVYSVTMMLAEARDLQGVLERTAKVVTEVMQTKACSIRLLNYDNDELVTKAVYNLSDVYLRKGPVRLSKAEADREALSPVGYVYLRDLINDPRTLYPEEARREGIVSMLMAGMRYKGKPIGVLRVYTEREQSFSQLQIDLLKAVAAQAAAAIENARLVTESIESRALERQVQMAADVQMRMIPQTPPRMDGLDLATIYVPCFELGGDFFDFIQLPYKNLGIAIADVSGKGVPASLIMASVRAALRAQVDNVYYIYETLKRINLMCCRDTKLGEFVTLFYGVYEETNRRLTYCNAGHPAGLVLRAGKLIELPSTNMVLGVDPTEQYTQSIVDLQPGDFLMLYTDGLSDAMNFQGETFGRQRVMEAFKKGGPNADYVAQKVLWEMRRFSGLSKRTDDVTLIVARVREPGQPA